MNNPWKGLDSYTEEDVKQQYSFCGRTRATGRLYSLITDRLVSTLYGRTGCGKTSLLQAGVFPLLRQDSFLPVMCRASLRRKDESFASYIIERVEQEMGRYGISHVDSEALPDKMTDSESDVLWRYMYGHRFMNESGEEVFPVIILDQFEEILINDFEDSALLLRQLDLLAGDTLVLPENAYSNFRIVFSIREDFLFLLEDALDEGGFTQLRDNRMRLTSMSADETEEVIELGRDCFEESDYLSIKNVIIRSSQDKRGHASTNMLSLCCSQCYELFKSKGQKLSTEDIKQTGQSLLKDFYLSCVNKVSNRTREYIEEHMVVNGRRSYVHMEQFLNHVPESDLKTLSSGQFKILQIINVGESQGVELIHDTLARVVYEIHTESEEKKRIQKEKQEQDIQTRQRKLTLVLYGIELLLWTAFSCLCIIRTTLLSGNTSLLLIVNLFVIAANILYSLASFGKSRFSKYHQVFIFVIDYLLFGFDVSLEYFDLDSTLGILCLFLSFALYIIIPIVNMTKSKDGLSKIGFKPSFKYVFRLKMLSERQELKPYLSRYAMVLLSVSMGFLSLWYKSNWFLFILFPICVVLTAWALTGRWKDNPVNPAKIKGLLLFWGAVSLLFTISQFCGHLPIYFAGLVLYAVWAFVSSDRYLEFSKGKRILNALKLYIVCGLLLPHLFLGYVPTSDYYVRRAWSQADTRLSEPNKVLLFRGGDGKQGVIAVNKESRGVLFNPVFSSIDSLQYQLKGDDTDSLHVFVGNEAFDWSDRFMHRGDSKMLRARIANLVSENVDWTEESYLKEAELAAGYRIIGEDSTALAVEYDYFLRRMLEAEMYDVLNPRNFRADAESCTDIITIYTHQLRDSVTWSGNYTEEFLELSQSNPILLDRAKRYLKPYVTNLKSESLKFSTVAQVGNVPLYHDLLLSYAVDTAQYSSVRAQLGNSDDMLFQTRNSVGKLVQDSVFAAAYSTDYGGSYDYLVSNAWHNIFLCRFPDAEEYARASVMADSTQKITYTNLITSLWLQGKYDEAYAVLSSKRTEVMGSEEGDYTQLLFPLQSSGYFVTVGEGVVQDMNHFIKTGVFTDTSSAEYFILQEKLSSESDLISDQGHFCYDNGINLSVSETFDKYMLYNDDGWRTPVFTEMEINVRDSVAICKQESNGLYRFLDLRSWQFIGEEYEYAWHFSEGVAAVQKDDKIGFIDYDGNFVINPQFPTEDWLKKNQRLKEEDHYRLAFHNGTCAVMGDDNEYRMISKDGTWYSDENWNPDFSLWYCKRMTDGVIVYQNKEWIAATFGGTIKCSQDKEIDDIILIRNENQEIYKAIYNHFDVTNVEDISKIPAIDISGVWMADDESKVYFNCNSSDFMWVSGDKVTAGRYYIDQSGNTQFLNFVFEDDSEVYFQIAESKDDYFELLDSPTLRERLQRTFGFEGTPTFYRIR